MEYLSGGSCGDLLKPGVFREDYIAIICRELLKGLEYLHGEGKLHRDIKGESVSGCPSRANALPWTHALVCLSLSCERFAECFRRRQVSSTVYSFVTVRAQHEHVMTVKLADFGVSGQLTATMTKKNTVRVNLVYIPREPELTCRGATPR